MHVDTEVRLADGDHVVHFYEGDDDLVRVVAGYLSAAVADGDAVVVIATPEHRIEFDAALAVAGINATAAGRTGRLVVLDAAGTLAGFMTGDVPDPVAFDRVVGKVVRDAVATGRPARAFGEMVAVLWQAGNEAGAIALERLWNELAERHPFSLFCAYPVHAVGAADAAGAFSEVCHLHSEVVGGAPTPEAAEVTRRFAATLDAPRLARRFVAETLDGWGRPDLVEDAQLVVTELATNAILHARSDVTVGLTRRRDGGDGVVYVVVGDASHAAPVARDAGPNATGGRGLRLVGALARRCGHEVVDRGKFVWAELIGEQGERSA